MKQDGHRQPYGRLPLFLLFILLFTLVHAPPPGRAAKESRTPPVGEEAISSAKAAAMTEFVIGEWVGARLLCRKEENNTVRCGKPVSFTVSFNADHTGSSTDEHFPKVFTYRWQSISEMILTSVPGGEELPLSQLQIQEGYLNFQTYIYLAVKDPSLPKESNYIHYIFDVHRVE